MSLYRDVTNKPWNQIGLPDGIEHSPVFAVSNERLALNVFMIIASVIFSLLLVSYYIRMGIGDWVPMSIPGAVWLNTAMLVLASVCLQAAVFSSRKLDSVRLFSGAGLFFFLGGLFAIIFAVGQYQVWSLLTLTGQGVRVNPSNSFFYLLTFVHVVHLLGGLWVWSKAIFRLGRGTTASTIHQTFCLCAVYWHFLLAVWFVLFFILANT
jgi:cytochrome c oxidase subunit III